MVVVIQVMLTVQTGNVQIDKAIVIVIGGCYGFCETCMADPGGGANFDELAFTFVQE